MRRLLPVILCLGCGAKTDLSASVPDPTGPFATGPATGHGIFPAAAPWTQDISAAPLDAQSSAIIATLQEKGWGLGHLQIDFSITVLRDDGSAAPREFNRTADFFAPDCDARPMPVPTWGVLEGQAGLACADDGDCHLIVIQGRTLYEMWRADLRGATFNGGCLAIWDLARVYPPEGRGDHCSSADAAGLPIAPLLFTADEVAGGEVAHAIRFILPDDRIRRRVFVHPASHATSTSGGATAVPYGARLRLRADYPVASLPSAGARVVARALQTYGMFLGDEGNVALTAESDRFSKARWDGLLGPRDLAALQPRDFQMVAGGTRIPYTGDCRR